MNTTPTILFSTLVIAISSQTRLESTLYPNFPTGLTESAQCEIVGLCQVSTYSHTTYLTHSLSLHFLEYVLYN